MSSKKILLFGAGHRIGCAIAKKYLQNGYSVIAHYRENRAELQHFIDTNPQYTSKIEWLKLDLLKEGNLLEEVVDWNSIEMVVYSVAQFNKGNLFDSDNFKEMVELNSFIPVNIARMYKNNSDSGIFTIFTDANISRVHNSYQNYRISKLFLSEFIRQMAVTVGDGFRINGIAPGTVLPPDEDVESYVRASNLAVIKKEVSLESVVSTVEFIHNNESLTGEIIHVDGGVHTI